MGASYLLTVHHKDLEGEGRALYVWGMKKTAHFTGHRWTDNEIKKLMQMWHNDVPLDKIAKKLNSTEYAILQQVRRMRNLGVPLKPRKAGRKGGSSDKPWTSGQIEYLIRRREEKASNEDISIELGRSWMAVQNMIAVLRREGVQIAMRGSGVTRKWSPDDARIIQCQITSESRKTTKPRR